ncbi:hypothetical protein MJG53_008328 [Ovis ammon polii x Ovis aries]|uniref:Uncharacterized protein n=1 Tax=Ovis ammon polii x Ovis aries TaxID=2918886 RepID=A0ACB9UZQ7_9CETA|nr:hypothetical protein MJG53_008328 [Ovis ammon polii x Ovis aries]
MESAEKEEISVEDEAVDKNIFKDCSKIAFYRRQKQLLSKKSTYRALLDSVTTGKDSASFQIINETAKVPLLAEVFGIEGNIFRLKINEEIPLKPRYEVTDVLTSKLTTVRLTSCPGDTGSLVLASGKGDLKCHVTANPFKVDLVSEEEVVMSINSLGQLYFEQLQIPPKQRQDELKPGNNTLNKERKNKQPLNSDLPLLLYIPIVKLRYTLTQMGPVAAKQKVGFRTDVHWMSESGIIDVFLLTGPTPSDVFKQYSYLTGTQAMPPLFALGYHQCRWNYEDEQDVKAVDAGFDEHNIPYDVMWLDIEHTEGKRYFTWDKKRFPNPKRMQDLLRSKKRKLVVISDPHIKVDPNYSVYAKAKEQGFFVRNHDGGDFEGVCWPGLSSYLDFTNPKVREWYSSLFAFSVYQGSTDILYVWNDMNEPSVFKGPEQTMQKNAIHHGNWEHRELHNIYGFYQQMATTEGLIQRSKGKERPFVLTRSFFAGSQKYADVGGFIGDPEAELLVRWYQAGAYQPFFRGHATRNTKRREPWLFGEEHTRLIREAIRERYTLLPYWYSLFYFAHVASQPVMRPLWVEFPNELETFSVEDEYMLGSALLVHPVTEPKASVVDVFLPGSSEIWYDSKTFAHWKGACTVKIPVTLDAIPVFQRGGSVVPIKTTIGRSTGFMTDSPYGLRVALSTKGSAMGEFYLDDGHSFQYLHRKQFLHRKFSFSSGVLTNSCADETSHYSSKCVVEQILVLGLKKQPSSVTAHLADGTARPVAFTYHATTSTLNLETLSLNVGADWKVRIQ